MPTTAPSVAGLSPQRQGGRKFPEPQAVTSIEATHRPKKGARDG
jgi:hypothetical protein